MSITTIKIHVTDPTKVADKKGDYISYKITSQVTRGNIPAAPITQDRRYSDFDWLVTELNRDFPGCIIAPLPEKTIVGKFASEFVESRRRSLERFLRRIASHPEIADSEIFLNFLQNDPSALSRFKEVRAASKPKLSTTAMNWFEGTVSSLTSKGEVEKSAADQKIEEIGSYIQQLEKQMSSTIKHSEALVKRSRDISQAIFELGQSLTYLGQSEGDALGTGLTQMGTSLDSLSALASAHAEAEAIKFLEPMDEYSRMIASIKTAMSQRQSKKDSYVLAMNDYESKQASYRKLVGVPGKEAQAKQKEQAMDAAKEAYENAKTEYERVTERLLIEFESFKSQRSLDMKEIVVDFISLQIDYNKKAEEEWNALLPKLQLLSLDANQPGGANNSNFASTPAPPGVAAAAAAARNSSRASSVMPPPPPNSAPPPPPAGTYFQEVDDGYT